MRYRFTGCKKQFAFEGIQFFRSAGKVPLGWALQMFLKNNS